MLTVRDHMILTQAELSLGSHLDRAGHIRHVLGVSEWQYARELDALIDKPEAEADKPVLVHRLRRLREARRRARSGLRAS